MVLMWVKIVMAIVWTAIISIVGLCIAPFDRRGSWYHRAARLWSRCTLWLFGVNVATKGLEYLDRSQRYVYVSNHASMFDIPAIFVAIPDDIRIVLKKELTRVPLWGWALKAGPYIAIDRFNPKDAMGGIEQAVEALRRGASVLVFAEGTRSLDGKLQPFKRGAFAVAARSGVPIVPVTVNNSFKIMPKGSLKIQPANILVVVDRPIESAGVMGKDDEVRLMQQVHAVLEKNFIGSSEGTPWQ
jgi:1-acyl-sn-glycerol-3-phosphate acyltransferase